jgi:hypothetical protein
LKVTITNKGEGFVEARFDAESNVETLILSTVAPVSVEAGVYMSSSPDFGTKKPPTSTVRFEGFSVPTHELMDKTAT